MTVSLAILCLLFIITTKRRTCLGTITLLSARNWVQLSNVIIVLDIFHFLIFGRLTPGHVPRALVTTIGAHAIIFFIRVESPF